MPFFDQNEAEAIELAPGVTCRPIWGERIMMGLIDIAPGAEIPDHTHPHEQCGRVLSGAFNLTIDGETRLVREGDHYVIPPGVPHSATGTSSASLALDIWSPIREDYLERLGSA